MARSRHTNSARTFSLAERAVADLDAMRRLLTALLRRQDCAIVRGSIADPARTTRVRRLFIRDVATGDEPTLLPAAHHWLALNLDKLPKPDGIDPRDLQACGAAALAELPSRIQRHPVHRRGNQPARNRAGDAVAHYVLVRPANRRWRGEALARSGTGRSLSL